MSYEINPWLLLPFGLLLGAIALGPLVGPVWWARHYPKVAYALGAVTFLGVVYPITWFRRMHTREQTELALGGTPFSAPLVPFGVFLAPAAMLTLLWGEAWLGWLIGS